MNDEQKYIFDTRGYIVLKKVVPPDVLAACHRALDRYEHLPEDQLPAPLKLGSPDAPNKRFLSNVLDASPEMVPLIDLPAVVDVIQTVSGSNWRLNHTYAMYNGKGYHTTLHMGGTPLYERCQYAFNNGQIYSSLTKAVIPLGDCRKQDGAFGVIAGSHKANYRRPWGEDHRDNPLFEPVECEAGDVIVFTEALTHGSYVNETGRPRRTLYFCYSVGWMPDWGSQGLRFSEAFLAGLPPEQQRVLALK